MEGISPGALTVLWPWLDAVSRLGPLLLADLVHLILDVAKMYRDNIAPDPGSLPRGYGGEQRGSRSFLHPGRFLLETCLPERAVTLRRYLLLAI